MVRYELSQGVAWITLTSVDNGNALSEPLCLSLTRSIAQANAAEECRAVVLTAEGAQFCSGLDLESAFGEGRRPTAAHAASLDQALASVHGSSVPVIACVEGNVTGGGLGLVAACDIVLARPEVRFQLSEAILGMIPAMISPFLLQRMLPGRLRYLTVSTRAIDGREAKDYGLVDELFEENRKATLERQLARLFRCSRPALAEYKRYLDVLTSTLEHDRSVAVSTFMAWIQNDDAVRGAQQFADGLTPPWFKTYRGGAR